MSTPSRRLHAVAWLALGASLSGACVDAVHYQDRAYSASGDGDASLAPGAGRAGADGADRRDAGAHEAADDTSRKCLPAMTSEALHARSTSLSHVATTSRAGVFTADLFGLFQSNCGGCHVDNKLGGFQVSLLTFPTLVSEKAFERITSDDPSFFMPPAGGGGAPFSKRPAEDPVRELATLLEAWLAAGRPADVFYPSGSDGGPAASPYLLTKAVGGQMTNLGNCIPPKAMYADSMSDADAELDAMFEQAVALPDRLEKTDLVSLDAEVLAGHGVIAFAPAYTLWADNAKKLRMVRVPIGTSLQFDSATQSFAIPPNTRLYKTFFKKVIDRDGNDAYRKLETRLIVVRPDELLPDGTRVTRALFGSYAWDEEETEAVLVQDPLRNGKPFRDRIFTYVTDEHAAEAVITTGPDNLQTALEQAGVSRTYAIPGSERCIQCHMGSPTGDFALGLTPLQLLRRPTGKGGTYEPTERDEQNQLQRLIDYGLITGMDSPADVVQLEDSEGDRKPRNEHELNAQAYMLGNCAHCHNPKGFPSTIAPELRDVLDFLPSEHGGIFQFPIERFSPRIFRGETQSEPIPYITPSLLDHDADVTTTTTGPLPLYSGYQQVLGWLPTEEQPKERIEPILAPWRSLIYRNVDTPFTYGEDYAIYPRMPLNTPGYDCRVRRLLGTWMTSIPARMKETEPLPGQKVYSAEETEFKHPDPQPFVEVLPDDPDYARQNRAAAAQVRKFEQSLRYSDCPGPEVDTVDPAVVRGEALVPRPLFGRMVLDADGEPVASYLLNVPERPHYAITDLTDPPGEWYPRRPDWYQVLVEQKLDGLPPAVQDRVKLLQDVVLTPELRAYALTGIPLGLWKVKDTCDFSAEPKLADFTGDMRPRWMDVLARKADEPVYNISPGGQVFTMICSNCHGPLAESKGRLAATIADMTGGQTRVANLRDGIFGPSDAPGANRERVFAPGAVNGITTDDVAARYLAFMGLGGTQRTIPQIALETIRNGSILGEERPAPGLLSVTSANMLSVPVALCRAVLPAARSSFIPEDGDLDYSSTAEFKSALIENNGDLELWRKLCAFGNAKVPVRVVTAFSGGVIKYRIHTAFDGALREPDLYPADAAVGDQRGKTRVGITPDNTAPWCLLKPVADAELRANVETAWAEHEGASVLPPYCPDAFVGNADNSMTKEEGERWATRGAMNAGLAVFVYLDALAKGEITRAIPYDRCEDLN